MNKEGAVLLLSVFHHSVIGSDEFAGMCVVACKDIPHFTPDPQRKELTLPLFRYSTKTFALAELDARASWGDPKANSFFKLDSKKVLGDLPRFRSRSRSKGSVSNLEDSQAV